MMLFIRWGYMYYQWGRGGHLFWLVDSVRDGPDVVAQFNAHHLGSGRRVEVEVEVVVAGFM